MQARVFAHCTSEQHAPRPWPETRRSRDGLSHTDHSRYPPRIGGFDLSPQLSSTCHRPHQETPASIAHDDDSKLLRTGLTMTQCFLSLIHRRPQYDTTPELRPAISPALQESCAPQPC